MVVDVHPPGVADLPVNHHYLPVIAVVELRDQVQQVHPRIGELDDFDAGFPHGVVVGRGNREIGDVLVQEADLDPLPRLLHQKPLDRLAALVVPEVEIFNVDGFLGRQDVLAQQVELPLSVGDDLDVVAGSDRRVTLRSEKPCQRPEFFPDGGFVVMPEEDSVQLRCGLRLEDVHVPLMPPVEDPVMPVVDSEHQVEHKTRHRKHRDDKQPSELPS